MSAYLCTQISGNENFGGYLSVDGEKSFSISDGMIYELSPGAHSFIIYSSSDAQRAAGSAQAWLYKKTSSSGAILDSLERASASKNIGDGWQIDAYVTDGEMLTINVVSRGTKIVGNPQYSVCELDDAQLAELEKKQEEAAKEYEEWKNTPVRSKKQIIGGLITALLGCFGLYNYLSGSVVTEEPTQNLFLVMGGIIAIGVLFIFLGAKKKVRRK